jgi:hypothetical protein
MWSPLSRPRSSCSQAIALWELLKKRFQTGLGQELEKRFAFSVVGPSSHDIRLRTCGRGFIARLWTCRFIIGVAAEYSQTVSAR